MKLQEKIKKLLNKYEMTITEIAGFVGVSEQSIYRWGNGKKHKVHRIFENKIDELLEQKNANNQHKG